MSKPNVPDVGGVRRIGGSLKSSFQASKSASQKQGQGFKDKNSSSLGYNKDALRSFQSNPARSM